MASSTRLVATRASSRWMASTAVRSRSKTPCLKGGNSCKRSCRDASGKEFKSRSNASRSAGGWVASDPSLSAGATAARPGVDRTRRRVKQKNGEKASIMVFVVVVVVVVVVHHVASA